MHKKEKRHGASVTKRFTYFLVFSRTFSRVYCEDLLATTAIFKKRMKLDKNNEGHFHKPGLNPD